MLDKVVLGTRGSELAQTQTRMVAEQLRARWPQLTIETRIVKTAGDERTAKEPTADTSAGRKGLFTAAIEEELLARHVDIAVHSAKDLPSDLTGGTQIAAVLRRESPDDVLIAPDPHTLESLPRAGIVATGSVRRKHQLRWKRPDLEIVELRGNVPTRLRKLAGAGWHAIILAGAGLERLRLSLGGNRIRHEDRDFFVERLPREVFLPAGGQGIIAMQIRKDDERTRRLVEPINDGDTSFCLRAEREFLRLLHGDCNQPVGVLATVADSTLKMQAQVFRLGATTPIQSSTEGRPEDGEALAAELLERINGAKK